jgi:hypothetical protein
MILGGRRIASEVGPVVLISGYCLSAGLHDLCNGSRGAGRIWPCYCTCHYPEPHWTVECHHHAGMNSPDYSKRREVTPRMRQAIANFHKTHKKIKRVPA